MYTVADVEQTSTDLQGGQNNRVPVVAHPTEVKELTTYKDGEIAVSHEIEGPTRTTLWDAAATVKDENLQTVMGRSYEVGSFTWNSTDTVGTRKIELNFPEVIVDNPQINSKWVYFSMFRCKAIKVGFRINSTEFHYGRLLVSYVVGHLSGATAYHDANYATRRNNHPYLISAMSGETHELQIPWQLPMNFLNNTRSNPWVEPASARGIIARVTVDVFRPLRMTTVIAPSVDVSVFASFVEPELVAAVMPSTLPAAFERETFLRLMKEQVKREQISSPESEGPLRRRDLLKKVNAESGQFVDAFSTVSGAVQGISNAVNKVSSSDQARGKDMKESEDKAQSNSLLSGVSDVVSTVSTMINLGESVSESVAPLLALLDKPANVQMLQPYASKPGSDMMHGTGSDNTVRMSLGPEAQLSSKSDMFGQAGIAHVYDAIRTPGYFRGASFTTNTLPGQLLLDFGNCPWWAPVGPAKPGYNVTYTPDYCAWYSQLFGFWRGSMRYMFIVSAAKFTTCRIRITFLPNTLGVASTSSYTGDVYSRVVDIRGDTEIDLVIPFLYPYYYAAVSKNLGASDTEANCTGKIMVELVTQPVSNDAAVQDLYIDVYRAAGDDFQFNFCDRRPLHDESNPRYVLETHTPMLVQTQNDVKNRQELYENMKSGKYVVPKARQEAYLYSEKLKAKREKETAVKNVTAECSIFERFKAPMEPITRSTGYQEVGHVAPEVFGPMTDIGKAYNQWYYATNGNFNFFPSPDPTIMDAYHWIQMPFIFYRGSCRMKFIGDLPDKFASFGTLSGGTYHSSASYVATSTNNVLDVEMPWYSRVPFTTVNGTYQFAGIDEHYRSLTINATSSLPYTSYIAMGDDFQLGCMFSPPIIGEAP
jgi:hypothetical protein